MTVKEAANQFAEGVVDWMMQHTPISELEDEIKGAIRSAYLRGHEHENNWHDAQKENPDSTGNYIALIGNDDRSEEYEILTFLSSDEEDRGLWVCADDFTVVIEFERVYAWMKIPIGASEFLPEIKAIQDELPF